MKKSTLGMGALSVAGAALFAMPAAAEEISFYFGSDPQYAPYYDSQYDGTDSQNGQNAHLFSAFLGDGTKVNVRATSWAIDSSGSNPANWSSTHSAANTGRYSTGLGTCNDSEGGPGCQSNYHTVDNYGDKDYIALHFDHTVDVEQLRVRLYDYFDNDGYGPGSGYTVLVGSVNTGFGTFIDPKAAFPDLSTLSQSSGNFFVSNGWGTEGNFDWGSGDGVGNVVLIGGDFGGGNPIDAFKLKSLVVDVREGPPPDQVPAPAALGLMGLGLLGLGLRRRQRNRAAA